MVKQDHDADLSEINTKLAATENQLTEGKILDADKSIDEIREKSNIPKSN